MPDPSAGTVLTPDVLTQIIDTQTAIVKLGQDLGAVMHLMAERLPLLTGAGGAIVELAEGEEMVYRAVSGIAQSNLGLRLRRQGSLSGLCVATADILTCHDSEQDQRVDRDACRKVGLRSMVVAPLLHAETVVGVLKILSPEANHFNELHIEILSRMSELVAAAMFYAARHERDELYHLATHDSMTGLANRALFYDRLRQAMTMANRNASCLGVMILDMDGLKAINDTHGHRAGDAAISELAERLHAVSRQSDTVARLGGDEFGVVLPEVQSLDNARKHAERVESAVCRPFSFESTPLELGASIGVALFPTDGTNVEGLLEKADQAMYRVKRTRKSRDGGPRSTGEQ
ncbi:sensor domain-containing diguanylate cyclase [Desulfocurvus vexinensis]|uniref:sensor domain-containing diguanylate cyclase n=1 Tax=Desulfocurvus vexinensis TaxID=399548 RepID=UPI0004AFC6E3|nr:sensor domain-containing diguanylate cyclase [Desulfocurvus vexinensis]